MKYSVIVAVFAAFVSNVTAADGVKGAAEGFAKGMWSICAVYMRSMLT